MAWPSDMAWGLMMQHVQSEKMAVLKGPWPIVEGKKNSSSWHNKHITMALVCVWGLPEANMTLAGHAHSCCGGEWLRAMANVFECVGSELGADALLRFRPCHSGVCGSQEPPPDRHGFVTHQLHGNHRARGHKLHQVAAKMEQCWI